MSTKEKIVTIKIRKGILNLTASRLLVSLSEECKGRRGKEQYCQDLAEATRVFLLATGLTAQEVDSVIGAATTLE